jgi:hypothetical protein
MDGSRFGLLAQQEVGSGPGKFVKTANVGLVNGQLAPVNEGNTSCEWDYDVEEGLLIAGETESWWSLVLSSPTLEEAASNYTLAQEWNIVWQNKTPDQSKDVFLKASDVTLLISGEQNLLIFMPAIQSIYALLFCLDAIPFKIFTMGDLVAIS